MNHNISKKQRNKITLMVANLCIKNLIILCTCEHFAMLNDNNVDYYKSKLKMMRFFKIKYYFSLH